MGSSAEKSDQENLNDYVEGKDFKTKLFLKELLHIRNRDTENKSEDIEQNLGFLLLDDTQKKELDELTGDQKKARSDVKELRKNLFGIAFSGGGIRSATFSLGVMQALAEKKSEKEPDKSWLSRFHYLSTVSGGGYIGSSLTWLLHGRWKHGQYDTGGEFPFQRDHHDGKVEASRSLIRYLRQHSCYLTPGGGITAASMLAVILRGALISLLIFTVPVLVAMTLLYQVGFFSPLSLPIPRLPTLITSNWLMLAVTLLISLFGVLSLIYGLISRASFGKKAAYILRREFEKFGGRLLALTTLFLLLASLPIVYNWLHRVHEAAASATASGLTLGGLISAVVSIMKSQSDTESRFPVSVIAPVALALLVYGLLLLFYWGAVALGGCVGPWLWGLLILSFILSIVANINYLSIHRYYRDRLMELFMPDVDEVLKSDRPTPAAKANGSSLHEMCDFGDGEGAGDKGPYHIINANMVTIDSHHMRLSARGGDNFILSPLYCGSEATGWRKTKKYMSEKMNLATAMAISGAAADPHGAPGGEGLTRNRSLSLLMALLNVRLGYWAPNPDPKHMILTNSPNWLVHGLRELTGRGMDEESRYVHLADGGHFENLAVYELIRRKVKTIVVCDGAADPGYSFNDLSNFVEKVRVDFGVEIEFPSLLELCPKPDYDQNGNLKYPNAVETAAKGYTIANIIYENGKTGTLIYIKTTMIEHLPKDLYSYKSGHPSFPDETTADQFFDEKQFEAYRELGYQIGRSLRWDKEVSSAFGDKPENPPY